MGFNCLSSFSLMVIKRPIPQHLIAQCHVIIAYACVSCSNFYSVIKKFSHITELAIRWLMESIFSEPRSPEYSPFDSLRAEFSLAPSSLQLTVFKWFLRSFLINCSFKNKNLFLLYNLKLKNFMSTNCLQVPFILYNIIKLRVWSICIWNAKSKKLLYAIFEEAKEERRGKGREKKFLKVVLHYFFEHPKKFNANLTLHALWFRRKCKWKSQWFVTIK